MIPIGRTLTRGAVFARSLAQPISRVFGLYRLVNLGTERFTIESVMSIPLSS